MSYIMQLYKIILLTHLCNRIFLTCVMAGLWREEGIYDSYYTKMYDAILAAMFYEKRLACRVASSAATKPRGAQYLTRCRFFRNSQLRSIASAFARSSIELLWRKCRRSVTA